MIGAPSKKGTTMSSRNRIKIVEDIIADNASARVVDQLVDVLGYAIERIAPTLARSAAFRLEDFATARTRGIDGFILELRRECENDREVWIGDFEKPGQRVRIRAALG
jgi:hypothetical protein